MCKQHIKTYFKDYFFILFEGTKKRSEVEDDYSQN